MKNALTLSVTSGAWQLFRIRRADKRFAPLRDKVLARDNHTCQFCDFQAKQYMEIINRDGNYRHNKPSNLITACPFCAQCFFLDAIGNSDFGGGRIIYLPELSQAALNSFCHVLFCAMVNHADQAKTAQALYRAYKLRSSLVDETLGEGTHHPGALGQLLLELAQDDKAAQRKIVKDLRLLPARAEFDKQIRDWAKSQLTTQLE